jgi:hypothetical protein
MDMTLLPPGGRLSKHAPALAEVSSDRDARRSGECWVNYEILAANYMPAIDEPGVLGAGSGVL